MKDVILVLIGVVGGVLANAIWHAIQDAFTGWFVGNVYSRFASQGLTGIWLSTYDYPSASDGNIQRSQHLVVLFHLGKRVSGRSLPQPSGSKLRLDLRRGEADYLTGAWLEHTSTGRIYQGGIHLTIVPTQDALEGIWIGYDRRRNIRSGRWTLTRISKTTAQETRIEMMLSYPLEQAHYPAGVNSQDGSPGRELS